MSAYSRIAALLLAAGLALACGSFTSPSTGVAASKKPFSEADLATLLAKNPNTGRPVDTIAELLPLLPQDLRANFTFVYASRSPFKASITPRQPRVILFSDDAKLVLTFTGDPSKAGADVLETMAFDVAKARFAFTAYTLPAARRRGFAMTPAAADCGSCHGTDPRPIYDSYPLWPGFYGAVLDTFPHDALGTAEWKTYASFLATSAKTGVYAALAYRAGSRTTPFLDPRQVNKNTVELDPKAFPFLPNARLGMALTELNRQRIYRKLAAGPRFARNEKRILAMLLECRGAQQPRQRALAATQTALERENADRLRRLGTGAVDPDRDLHDMQELSFVRELTQIEMAASDAGVGRADWSMAMEQGSLAFFDGILSGIFEGRSFYLKEDLIFELLAHLAAREPAFRRFFAYDAVFAPEGHTFGHRIEMGPALASCPYLRASRPPVDGAQLASARR